MEAPELDGEAGYRPDPWPLTLEHIRVWFAEAGPRWKQPPDEALEDFRVFLALAGTSTVDDPPLAQWNPTRRLLYRIRRTVRALTSDMHQALLVAEAALRPPDPLPDDPVAVAFGDLLPPIIDDARRLLQEDVKLFESLLAYERGLFRLVEAADPTPNNLPFTVVYGAEAAWRAAGRTKVGTAPSSPLVQVLVPALAWVEGYQRTPDGVSRALARSRKKGKAFSALLSERADIPGAAIISRMYRVTPPRVTGVRGRPVSIRDKRESASSPPRAAHAARKEDA